MCFDKNLSLEILMHYVEDVLYSGKYLTTKNFAVLQILLLPRKPVPQNLIVVYTVAYICNDSPVDPQNCDIYH